MTPVWRVGPAFSNKNCNIVFLMRVVRDKKHSITNKCSISLLVCCRNSVEKVYQASYVIFTIIRKWGLLLVIKILLNLNNWNFCTLKKNCHQKNSHNWALIVVIFLGVRKEEVLAIRSRFPTKIPVSNLYRLSCNPSSIPSIIYLFNIIFFVR